MSDTEPIPTFHIAASMGRGKELSDEEFYLYVLEAHDGFTSSELARIKSILSSEPWASRVLLLQADRAEVDQMLTLTAKSLSKSEEPLSQRLAKVLSMVSLGARIGEVFALVRGSLPSPAVAVGQLNSAAPLYQRQLQLPTQTRSIFSAGEVDIELADEDGGKMRLRLPPVSPGIGVDCSFGAKVTVQDESQTFKFPSMVPGRWTAWQAAPGCTKSELSMTLWLEPPQ